MDETQLKRHNLVFISKQGKDKIWSDISPRYDGESKHLAEEVLQGNVDIPGFIRRNDAENTEGIAIGFVHHKRIDGNRIRIGACTAADDIVTIMTPYEVLTRRAFAFTTRNRCMQIVRQLYELAYVFDLQIGVLGSAALELITGLPYTDENSDIDLIVKPPVITVCCSFTAQHRPAVMKLRWILSLICPMATVSSLLKYLWKLRLYLVKV